MRKKFIVYSLLFIVSIFVLTTYDTQYTIYASDATPSADIKSKLEEFKKEIASKAAKLKQQVNQKLQNKVYVGMVQEKSETSITISDKQGRKTIKINQDTVYDTDLKPKLKYSYKLVEKDDYIAALGEVDDLGNLVAKKVVLLPTETITPKTILWGQIISLTENTATIRNNDLKNTTASFAKLDTNAKISDFVIATGFLNKNQVLQTSFVYVIPQGGFIKSKKIATPSATISTPSSTPSTKKK